MKLYDLPDESGHFGRYGGSFVTETLVQALDELRDAYFRWSTDPEFIAELDYDLKHYVGRPSPVYHAGKSPAIFMRLRNSSPPRNTCPRSFSQTLGKPTPSHTKSMLRLMARPRCAENWPRIHSVCSHSGASSDPTIAR